MIYGTFRISLYGRGQSDICIFISIFLYRVVRGRVGWVRPGKIYRNALFNETTALDTNVYYVAHTGALIL